MFIMHFMTSDIPLRQNILAIITNLNGIGIVFALFYRSVSYLYIRIHKYSFVQFYFCELNHHFFSNRCLL